MNISESNETLQDEALEIDFTSMAEKPSGAWASGWYPVTITEGYSKGGYQYLTENSLSKAGNSFNLRLCLRVTNDGVDRMDFFNFNYRPIDFSAERREVVENLKEQFKGQGGSWVGFKDEQRSSLAMRELGNLQVATGAKIRVIGDGSVDPTPFIGTSCFAKLIIDPESGYNKVKAFSKYANGVEPRAKKGKR